MNFSISDEKKNIIKKALIADGFSVGEGASFFNNCDKYSVFAGFVDVHVHLREPGFIYKETIKSGTLAAAHGGYTEICSMPNLSPVPDSKENLEIQLNAIKNDAVIGVHPYGSITAGQKGEMLSDMDALATYVAGFSDDGRGVQSDKMMKAAMTKAKSLNKPIVAHCEINELLRGGYIHDGEYAEKNGHKGICSESEWGQIKRDIELVRQTGCKYHVCHISTKESVDLIRQAKADGIDITCETAPHYLVFDDSMLEEDGRFKMNPPIRAKADRDALIEGIIDGTIDMIATDHAPHSKEEKSKGLKGSLMGVVGLETAFAVLYTKLVKTEIITLDKLIQLMCINPRKRFNMAENENDFCIWDLTSEYEIDPETFLSMGRSTPFDKMKVFGKCIMTVKNGKIVWLDRSVI